MNVATCKFFLQGTCRFGDRCRFFHPPGDQSGFYGNQPNSNSVYSQIQESRFKLNENVKAIEEVVKKDMVEWEKGKIWPFSCYGPCAGKPNLDGFEDLSPEELRFATMQNQGVPPNSIAMRFQMWNGARAKYQRTTQANLEALEAIIIGTPKLAAGTAQTFGLGNTMNTGSLVGQTSAPFGQGNTTLAGNLGNQSAFGGKAFGSLSPTAFGTNPNSNPAAMSSFSFSLNKNVGQTESMEDTGAFGMAAPQTGFGGSSALSTFSFNQAIGSSTPQSQLQAQQPAPVNQGFSNISPFQQQQQQQQPQPNTMNAFTMSSPATQQFPGNTGANQFGNFGGGISSSPFGGASIFGGQQQQPQQPTATAPGFPDQAKSQQLTMGGAGAAGVMDGHDKTIYSALSDLTPEDIRAFEAPQFSIDSLPIRAPAKKFCL